jgi:hypothetical protein
MENAWIKYLAGTELILLLIRLSPSGILLIKSNRILIYFFQKADLGDKNH